MTKNQKKFIAARILLPLVLGAVMLPVSQANADHDGNELLDYCTREEGTFGSGVCSGYITGVVSVLASSGVNGFRACIPDNVTRGQIRRVIVARLEKNPALLHYGASGLVAEALEIAFPC
jgi:hypothetical protein